jgi:NADH:ubiquinone oxidoreductase subunit H
MRICTSQGIYGDRIPLENIRVSSGVYAKRNPENSEYHKPNSIERALATVPVKRGDIVLIDFGSNDKYCKIIGSRPAIVVSATEFNMVSPIITVIPMTKSLRMIDNSEHIFVDKDDCKGLREFGMAL